MLQEVFGWATLPVTFLALTTFLALAALLFLGLLFARLRNVQLLFLNLVGLTLLWCLGWQLLALSEFKKHVEVGEVLLVNSTIGET